MKSEKFGPVAGSSHWKSTLSIASDSRVCVLIIMIIISYNFSPFFVASLVAQMVNKLRAMQETWVWWLGGEDPLGKGMAAHSSILPGEFHGQRSLAGYIVHGVAKNQRQLNRHTH